MKDQMMEVANSLLNLGYSEAMSLRLLRCALLEAARMRYQGNKSETARRLDIHRNLIERRIREMEFMWTGQRGGFHRRLKGNAVHPQI